MSVDLTGQVGIVTGAAQGLGLAIARAFVEAHMRVVLMDVDAEKLQIVQRQLGADTLALAVDLSRAEPTQQAIADALKQFGTPRILVHNAAILIPRALPDVSLDEWQQTLNVGIQAAFILTQAVWQPMTDAGLGSIVYVSSRSGIQGFADESAYCATKHGLEGMMKALALEGKPRNIAVNTITPGMYMHTPMSERNYPEELKQKWVEPYLLTPAFVQLARQDAAGITGQRLDAWAMSETMRQS